MPTALELSREEWQPYIEAAKKRMASPNFSSAEQEQREQLLMRVRDAARQLKSEFNVQRVILFGSLADADWFVSDSDVDLAIEGLAPDNFWHACGRCHWRSAFGFSRD